MLEARLSLFPRGESHGRNGIAVVPYFEGLKEIFKKWTPSEK
jgi:hypothetical protein